MARWRRRRAARFATTVNQPWRPSRSWSRDPRVRARLLKHPDLLAAFGVGVGGRDCGRAQPPPYRATAAGTAARLCLLPDTCSIGAASRRTTWAHRANARCRRGKHRSYNPARSCHCCSWFSAQPHIVDRRSSPLYGRWFRRCVVQDARLAMPATSDDVPPIRALSTYSRWAWR